MHDLLRGEDLVAPGEAEQPRGQVDGAAEVIALAVQNHTPVDAGMYSGGIGSVHLLDDAHAGGDGLAGLANVTSIAPGSTPS